jgi:hypothetical protein
MACVHAGARDLKSRLQVRASQRRSDGVASVEVASFLAVTRMMAGPYVRLIGGLPPAKCKRLQRGVAGENIILSVYLENT